MRLQELLVPIDFSEATDATVARAIQLAKSQDSHVHLLHAIPPLAYPAAGEFAVPVPLAESLESTAAENLSAWVQKLTDAGCSVSSEMSWRVPADAICEVAERRGSALIVMGTHGYTGLKHAFLGSVAQRTLRGAPCPVLVEKRDPASAAQPIRKVLVCTDFSKHAKHAVETATALCKLLEAELDLIHVHHLWTPEYYNGLVPTTYIDDTRARARGELVAVREEVSRSGVGGKDHLLVGDPVHEIVELSESEGHDLVVMGTHGYSALQHVFLGSVAERALRGIQCAVLSTKVRDQAG